MRFRSLIVFSSLLASLSAVAGHAFTVYTENTTGNNDKAVLVSQTCMHSDVNSLDAPLNAKSQGFATVEDDSSVMDHCAIPVSKFTLDVENASGQVLGEVTYNSSPGIPTGGPCLYAGGEPPYMDYKYCFNSSDMNLVDVKPHGDNAIEIEVK